MPKWVRMTAPILRLIVRSAALLALAVGFVVGSAGLAGAQLPELPAPGGEEAPDGEDAPDGEETPAPEGESPLPEELDPVLDPLQPVLDPLQPVLDQIPGAGAPEEGEDPADGTETEGEATTPTPSPAATSAAGAATLPRTGGTVAIGFAGAAAAAGLVLRRLLRV